MENPINTLPQKVQYTGQPVSSMERSVQSIEKLAAKMDSRLNIPGTKIAVGLDTIIGLVPILGDTVTFGVSGYIIARSARLGVPKRKLAHMGINSTIDWLIGSIPLVGDIFDIGWQANNKNAEILRQHFEKHHRQT